MKTLELPILDSPVLDTDALSARYRRAAVDLDQRRLLITNFRGTDQEQDLTEPANCGGFGRVRHFRRTTSTGWPENPLPIDPASRALGLGSEEVLRAQVFQNAVCNWRCWYCFVDFKLLAANQNHSDWRSAGELIDLFLAEPDRPRMIDLTGGQPDLTPEWIPWMMAELTSRGLDREIYLWSDDNLSNDYFWRHLDEKDRELVASYPMYGRVCCFKGFDAESFSFNTRAAPALFDRQFQIMSQLVASGIDVYAYATLTGPTRKGIAGSVRQFIDRLQEIDERLPLRTVPLEVRVFTPVKGRMDATREAALVHQQHAIETWSEELARRFTSDERGMNIVDIRLGG